jgi:DNA-binding FadR family transcriptional regulator
MPREFGSFSVRVPKSAELVAGHVRRQIVTGELDEGDVLPPESALMKKFDISRSVLREAIRILESEGLLTVRRGAHGGPRVHLPSADVAARYAGFVLQRSGVTLADVLEARVIVEAPAVRMLASRRDRLAMAKKLEEKLDLLDAETFEEFNRLVVSLAGNETLALLTRMLEHVCDAAALRRIPGPQDEKLAERAYRARVKLLELIRAGDADGAERLWRAHLTKANAVLVESDGAQVLELFG